MKVEELHDIFIEKLWYKNVDIENFWKRFDENINWILDTRNTNLIESIFKNIKEIKNNYSKELFEIEKVFQENSLYNKKNNWELIANIFLVSLIIFIIILFCWVFILNKYDFLLSILILFFVWSIGWSIFWFLISSLYEYTISDSKKEIEKSLYKKFNIFIWLLINDNFYNQKYNSFLKQIKNIKRKESKNNLLKMDPYDFEKLTAEVFNYFWFISKVTKWSWDHWIDINLTKNWEKYIVQCKRYNWTIGTPLMRDFIWTMQLSGINKWFFVTTWAFSSEVVKLINKNNFDIKLIDLDSLFNLITIKNDWWNINEFEMILSKWFENINNQAEQNIQNKKDWWNKYRWY